MGTRFHDTDDTDNDQLAGDGLAQSRGDSDHPIRYDWSRESIGPLDQLINPHARYAKVNCSQAVRSFYNPLQVGTHVYWMSIPLPKKSE